MAPARLDRVAGRHGTGGVRRIVGRLVESAFLVVSAQPGSLDSIGSLSDDPVRRSDRDDGGLHQGRRSGFAIGCDTGGHDDWSQADHETLVAAERCRSETYATPAILGIGVVGLFGLLFIGRFFGRLSTGCALTMLLAPLLCWVTEMPLLRHRKPWLVGSLRLAAGRDSAGGGAGAGEA